MAALLELTFHRTYEHVSFPIWHLESLFLVQWCAAGGQHDALRNTVEEWVAAVLGAGGLREGDGSK